MIPSGDLEDPLHGIAGYGQLVGVMDEPAKVLPGKTSHNLLFAMDA